MALALVSAFGRSVSVGVSVGVGVSFSVIVGLSSSWAVFFAGLGWAGLCCCAVMCCDMPTRPKAALLLCCAGLGWAGLGWAVRVVSCQNRAVLFVT